MRTKKSNYTKMPVFIFKNNGNSYIFTWVRVCKYWTMEKKLAQAKREYRKGTIILSGYGMTIQKSKKVSELVLEKMF